MAGITKPSQFRLGAATLAQLDAIAAHQEALTGVPMSRADVIRQLAMEGSRARGLAVAVKDSTTPRKGNKSQA